MFVWGFRNNMETTREGILSVSRSYQTVPGTAVRESWREHFDEDRVHTSETMEEMIPPS